MLVTIHQPEHLPWLGFFHKAAQADLLVLLDNVQYRHKYFQNRNRIRSQDGQRWINVPVLLKGYDRPLIKDIQINTSQPRWREKCWRSIILSYRKAKFFEDYAEFFEGVYSRSWDLLVDLNEELIKYSCGALGITTSLIRASELGVSGIGPGLILDIVRKTGADSYLSGVSGIAGRGSSPWTRWP
ncbi:MAG: WbqC family protein [Chloroflexi bacterium]|nr:WbqC family protein [Chloroflexota bacterium]